MKLQTVLFQFGFALTNPRKGMLVVEAKGNALDAGKKYGIEFPNPRVAELGGNQEIARIIERTVCCGCDSCVKLLRGLKKLLRDHSVYSKGGD